MKRGSTHFLRLVLVLIGVAVLAFCVFALPSIWAGGSAEFPEVSYSVKFIVIGMYVTAVPFFIALWQTFKLLRYIDTNRAFSELSVHALRNIKRCATVIAVIYVLFVPALFPIAEVDDAPGLILFGAAIACAPVAVAVFAAILQRLLQDAIAIKSENELTV